jgi:Ankyrin repeats (3 copies)/Ankyrin repeats (many copies)
MACETAKVMQRNSSPVVFLRGTAVSRRSEHRRAGVLAALLATCGLVLTPAPPAQAHESEQYTLPVGRNFADLGPYFSRIFYNAIVGAVAETNEAISATLEGQPTTTPLAELQSSEFIAGKVWEHVFAAIPANELLDAQLISEPVQSQFPGLVTMYRPMQSIYDDPLLVIDLTKAVRTFFRAGTVSAGGEVFGTDKLVHFINVGRIYHSKYERRIKRGLPEQEAIKSAIASTSRNLLTSEDGVLGIMTTGIHSNGDLAADFAGMQFYRNLTETIRVGSRTMPPMLVRNGQFWRVQAQPDSDFLTAFITPHWNEVLNPNKFVRYTSGRIRTLMRERCADAIDWYRDGRGQPRGRAQFEAIERELATYYGVDYGHESNEKGAVTMAAVCFTEPDTMARPGRSESPDALGRSTVWWAARSGDAAAVKQLTLAPGEVNAADIDGETPLHAATRAGSSTTVQELIARGADPNRAANYGVTPLMLAASSGKTDIASMLLKAGANPNTHDLFGRTPLHEAALRANAPLMQLLLAVGADPRAASDGGNTPLHLAARGGQAALAVMLVRAGADLQARNAAGATPYDLARSQWQWSTAEHLSRLARGESTPIETSPDGTLAYRTTALQGPDTAQTASEADARPQKE